MYASIVQQVNDIFIINDIKNQIDSIVSKDHLSNLRNSILNNLENFEKIQIKRL